MFWPLDNANPLPKDKLGHKIPIMQFKALLLELGLLKLSKNSLRMVKNMENLPNILRYTSAPFDIELNCIRKKKIGRTLNITIRDRVGMHRTIDNTDSTIFSWDKLDINYLEKMRKKYYYQLRKVNCLTTNASPNQILTNSKDSSSITEEAAITEGIDKIGQVEIKKKTIQIDPDFPLISSLGISLTNFENDVSNYTKLNSLLQEIENMNK